MYTIMISDDNEQLQNEIGNIMIRNGYLIDITYRRDNGVLWRGTKEFTRKKPQDKYIF